MLKVNGESYDMDGKSVAFAVESLKYDRTKIAVELNEDIVPKQTYEETILKNGDVVEVVSFVGGG